MDQNKLLQARKRLTRGNKKVDGLLFSLPPIKACLNCSSCASACYAVKSFRQYPSVRNLWEDNHRLAKHGLGELYSDLVDQLAKEKQDLVRVHQSGDFISQDYVSMWEVIARKFKNKLFYAYTKVDHLLDLSYLEALPNFVLISSFIDGKRNFGSRAYVDELVKDHGAVICPATLGEDVKCGSGCRLCMVKGVKVAFVEH